MKKILVKEYELSLKIRKKFLFIPYTKIILLKFEQAKVIDTIEFMESIKGNWTNIVIRLLRFIEKSSVKKLTKKDKDYIMTYADNIIPQVKDTFFE
jgi:primosomal protein N'